MYLKVRAAEEVRDRQDRLDDALEIAYRSRGEGV